MCGLCGIIKAKENTDKLDAKRVKIMCDKLSHRGPDDEGIFQNSFITFGHRRLSIIDLSGGHQPMSNNEGNIWLTFNGEIFNFKEIKKALLNKGHQFRTHSDTEVIIHAYEEYSYSCVNHFRGQFAFALWDQRNKTFFAARDRLGIKPFYYMQEDSNLIFASEIKALKSVAQNSIEISTDGLNEYLCFGYTQTKNTIYKNIYKLLPGEILILKDNKLSTFNYWDISETNTISSKNNSTLEEELVSRLKDSVNLRMISDVPIGAFLSGGIDSSIIVLLMRALTDSPLNTFAVSFQNEKYDESFYSTKISKQFNTHHRLLKGEQANIKILDKVAWYLDEPIAECASIPTLLMSELTKKYVTVVLSGDGGDEVFGGYNRYKILLSLFHTPSLLHPSLAYFINKLVRPTFRKNIFSLNECSNDIRKLYTQVSSFFNFNERNVLLRSNDNDTVENTFINSIRKSKDPLTTIQRMDLKSWLPNDVLMKVDKMGMCASIETRLPFLDHKVVEFGFSLPPQLRLNFFNSKILLKKAFKSTLPSDILKRKKHGFNVPLESLLSTEYINHLFEESPLYESLEKEKIKTILNNRDNNILYGNQFRNLFFLFLWAKNNLNH